MDGEEDRTKGRDGEGLDGCGGRGMVITSLYCILIPRVVLT